MDEDGQHDPVAIGDLLDTAMGENTSVTYAWPGNHAPHGFARNMASKSAKRTVRFLLSTDDATSYESLRLMTGEVAHSVAAYAGTASISTSPWAGLPIRRRPAR